MQNMFFSKQNWAVISLVILALAIGLTPRMPVGTIEGLSRQIDIRGEDIWIVVLTLVWGLALLKTRQGDTEKPPLLLPILFWLGIGFISVVLNWFSGNVTVPRGFFYFAKELQFFFVYFFTFFHLRGLRTTFLLLRIWLGIGVANIVWVVAQLFVIARRGEYGTAALAEWGVFPTGAFLLLLFIFLFNWWLYYFWRRRVVSPMKEYLYLMAILAVIFGLLGTLSRTVFVGFWFALIMSVLMYIWKARRLKAALASILLFAGISIFTLGAYFFLILPNLASADRLEDLADPKEIWNSAYSGRVAPVMIPQFQVAISGNAMELILGYGKGAMVGGETESHNQYLRNFVETGVVGSLAFIGLMIPILAKSWRGLKKRDNSLVNGLAGGVIVATLTMLFMSFIVDAFMVVKPNMLYWFFVGLTMAVVHSQSNK